MKIVSQQLFIKIVCNYVTYKDYFIASAHDPMGLLFMKIDDTHGSVCNRIH